MKQSDIPDWTMYDGEMGRMIGGNDWSSTSLGPLFSWPSSLVTAVDILLRLPLPALLLWGPQQVPIYNDGFGRLLGASHPGLLGRSLQPPREDFPEIITAIRERLMQQDAFVLEKQRITLSRHNRLETVCFKLTCGTLSPGTEGKGSVIITAQEQASPGDLEEPRQTPFQLLGDAVERLGSAGSRQEVLEVAGTFARELTGAAGISIVFRDGDQCHYLHEVSITGPVWAGQRFPLTSCVSGWVMEHRETAVIADVYADERVPREAYESSFVKSMVMMPIGRNEPFAAIAAYWPEVRQPMRGEVDLLETLGRTVGAALTCLETAERLRENEEHLSVLFEHAAVGLSELSLDGRFERVNDHVCNILGCSHDNLLGKTMIDIVHPDDLADTHREFQQTLRTGTTASLDNRYIRSDGTIIWASNSLTRLDDRNGNPVKLLAVTIDLTARRQAEEALRESEERYRMLAELNPDAILVNLKGHYVYANPAALRLLAAHDASEVIGHSSLDFVEPAYRNVALNRITRIFDSASPNPLMEQRWRRLDGMTIDVEVSSGLIIWGGKRAAQILLRDITERKQAEATLRASEERYRTLFESIDEGFCVIDVLFDDAGRPSDYRYLEVNPAFEKHTGLYDAAGKRISELVVQPDRLWIGIYGRVAMTGEPVRFVRRARALGNRWLSVYAFRIGGADTRRIAILFTDVTDQKQIQDELQISNERLNLAIEGSGDGIWDWDTLHDFYTCSRRLEEILECDEGESIRNEEDWRRRMHPDDLTRVSAILSACLEGRMPSYTAEYRVRARNGSWKWIQSRGIVVARDADGQPLRMTGVLTDISERKEADDRIWHYANFDTLTGLPNRRLFRDRLEYEVRKANRSGHQIALLFIDLDRFKQVNDLLGHDAGDVLLVQAAQRIRTCVRETDTVARLGGDEFTVILTELADLEHVEQVCQHILETLGGPFQLGKEVVYVSGSVGVTIYPEDADSSEELIRKADQAMYAAKNAGKNQFSYFTRSMDEKAHLRLRMASELRGALHAGQLQVHYQPVVELGAGRITKAEALLRWDHPTFGWVSPSQFIPLAEESGIINEIGNWVFKEVVSWSKRWTAKLGAPFQISVNKSPVQFLAHAEDIDWLQHLNQLGVNGNCITVEITEGMLLHASADVTGKLLEYRDAGVQVAIDDFGTGYSSMAYLKKFDIDYLKIDQSFVSDMATDAGNRTIAESIIVMAHKLGLQVIAEGIETSEQKELLAAAGCDYGQGYLFSPALPAQEFERMLLTEAQGMRSRLH